MGAADYGRDTGITEGKIRTFTVLIVVVASGSENTHPQPLGIGLDSSYPRVAGEGSQEACCTEEPGFELSVRLDHELACILHSTQGEG